MTDARVAAVEDNLLAFFGTAADLAMFGRDGHDDVLTYYTDIAFPLFNVVIGARFEPGTEAERAAAVLGPFLRRGLPFLWWTTPSTSSPALEEALAGAGMMREDVPGMYVELDHPTPPAADGVDITLVTAETRESMIVTMVTGFGMPIELTTPLGALMAAVEGEEVFSVLATVDGVPAGAGTGVVTGETLGVYNIATVEAHRGRGVGASVTAALMDHGRTLGCTQAILHATDMGRPVYERLGFREVCTVPQFLWLPDA